MHHHGLGGRRYYQGGLDVTNKETSDPQSRNSGENNINDQRVTSRQKFILIFGCAGSAMDGYVIAMVSFALLKLTSFWNLNDTEVGLLGAASLFGILVGGLFGGQLADRYGRRKVYICNMAIIFLTAVAQFFVQGVELLIAIRFILGLTIGCDYPTASTMVTEFSRTRQRGVLVGAMNAIWYVGAICAVIVGYLLLDLPDDTAWRWMLSSAAFPATIFLFGRFKTPESPLWLARQGRREESIEILHWVFGKDSNIDEFLDDYNAPAVKGDWKTIFKNRIYLKRLIYCGLFYGLMGIPVFGIVTFGPTINQLLGMTGSMWIWSYLFQNVAFLAGCIPALYLVDRWGRRPLNIWGYVFMTIGMLIVGAFANGNPLVILAGFLLFCVAQGGPMVLAWVIPNEVFPTEIRSTATGFATAISRIGSAVGTLCVPLFIGSLGVQITMYIMAGVCLVGTFVCYLLAEETKGLTLKEASAPVWHR